MSFIRLKYILFYLIMISALCLKAQDAEDQSIVTIIGDDLEEASNSSSSYIPVTKESIPPPKNRKIINNNQKGLAPTSENGLQMRLEVAYTKPAERLGGASFVAPAYNFDDELTKQEKRGVSIEERKFNAKKKLKAWLPQRKKKYRPTLCGRF